jgi:demethylmenaquinone methyltransferase/2-methoxy-6-polyprenyl-1,4-benzoquinol methylase
MSQVVTPYGAQAGSKKEQVARMFDAIAPRYDFLNHALSMGIDILWRRAAVNKIKTINPKIILDIATGTGDFAVEAARLGPDKIIGLDISEGMLALGRDKMKKKGLDGLIEMRLGDSEHLDLPTGYADAITVGFGVRNFENLERGLAEMLRVLRPGGMAVILEPAVPTVFPFKQLFMLYFTKILPLLGRLVSKDSSAYTYLPQSVRAFPHGADFVAICKRVGYTTAQFKPLTLGICAMYVLQK